MLFTETRGGGALASNGEEQRTVGLDFCLNPHRLISVKQPKDDLVKGACCGDARLVRSALRRGANPNAGY